MGGIGKEEMGKKDSFNHGPTMRRCRAGQRGSVGLSRILGMQSPRNSWGPGGDGGGGAARDFFSPLLGRARTRYDDKIGW